MTIVSSLGSGVKTFLSDVANGLLEITHNGFALLGLTVVFVALTLTVRPEVRELGEARLMGWLQERQGAPEAGAPEANEPALEASDRTTAVDPRDLPKQQASVAYWLSKKYRVAPEPLGALVAEAYTLGLKTKLDPTLILAIMAVESGFNPFAQSAMGAQGLMQVMTKLHGDKYENFGGALTAFDPLTNLRVGVKVLQECIARAGSLEGGLRSYVGAGNMEADGGYAGKVLAEHARLLSVAGGKPVPVAAPQLTPAVAPPAPEKVAALVRS